MFKADDFKLTADELTDIFNQIDFSGLSTVNDLFHLCAGEVETRLITKFLSSQSVVSDTSESGTDLYSETLSKLNLKAEQVKVLNAAVTDHWPEPLPTKNLVATEVPGRVFPLTREATTKRDDKPTELAPNDSGQIYGIIDPDYGRIFSIARVLAWNEGYSCCIQGSFTRDLDLLLTPWTLTACKDANHLIRRIAEATGLRDLGDPSDKPHGRRAYTLVFREFADPRFVDISVMPLLGPEK